MTVVRSAITQRVASLAATLGISVAYENNGFTPPANKAAFLELLIHPNDTTNWSVDGTRQRETGEIQINIWAPQNKGTKQSEDIFESIRTEFRTVPQTVTGVNIMTTPSLKKALVDPTGYRIVPVCFTYRYESSNP